MFPAPKLPHITWYFLSILLFVGIFTSPLYAQSSDSVTLGISRSVEIIDKDVQDGNIISSSEKGALLSVIPYDSQVMGVVSSDAAIVLNQGQNQNEFPIVSDGFAHILVSSKEGAIKKGDLLTTSIIPGVAVKATKSGYVLGSALEDFSNSDPKKYGKIAIDLNLHYYNSKSTFPGSLTDILKLALLTTKDGPSAFFKYFIAALVAVGSIILGFLSFARTAAKGVEALGRNPAASRIIHLGIIINVSITIVIVSAGLFIALLILRL